MSAAAEAITSGSAPKICAGDGMFVLVEIEIAERASGIAREPFGAGEFRHDQAAAAQASESRGEKRCR